MEQLHFTDYKVVAMNNRSLTFEINGEHYFACKRVANDILKGNTESVYVETTTKCGQEHKWLSTPSRF